MTIDTLAQDAIRIGQQSGYVGLAALMFLNTSIGFPPSELICVAFGAMAARTEISLLNVVLVAAAFNTAGTALLFVLARHYARPRVRGLLTRLHSTRLSRLLDLIGFGPAALEAVDELFSAYGIWIVFLGRNIPVLRSVISVPAGLSAMPFTRFAACTSCGILIWVTLWSYAGYRLGRDPLQPTSWITLAGAFGGVAVFGYALKRYARKTVAARSDSERGDT